MTNSKQRTESSSDACRLVFTSSAIVRVYVVRKNRTRYAEGKKSHRKLSYKVIILRIFLF